MIFINTKYSSRVITCDSICSFFVFMSAFRTRMVLSTLDDSIVSKINAFFVTCAIGMSFQNSAKADDDA